jgi:hypothetical protein
VRALLSSVRREVPDHDERAESVGTDHDSSRTLTLTGTSIDPANRSRALYRSVDRLASPSGRTLHIFVQPPTGPEVRTLTVDLHRRA